MPFESDDTYNVIADHVLMTLQADTKLGEDGDLEVKVWEHQFREDASTYQDNELPAVAAKVSQSSGEVVTLGGTIANGFEALIMVTTRGGRQQIVVQEALRIGARIERVLRRQFLPDEQFMDLPSALEGGVPGSVDISEPETEADGGKVKGSLRGVAVISVGIALERVTPDS